MKTKQISLLLSALLVTLFNGVAVAATQQEAEAQLDRIPALDDRSAAKQVLNNLVQAGMPVDDALSVVTNAIKRDYDPAGLRSVGAEMREQLQQGIPSGMVVRTAENAINANYSAAQAVGVLNAFQGAVNSGTPAEQAFVNVNSGIGGSGAGEGSQAARSGTGTGTSNNDQTGAGTGTGTGSNAGGNGTGTGAGSNATTNNPVAGFGSGNPMSAGAPMGAAGATFGAGPVVSGPGAPGGTFGSSPAVSGPGAGSGAPGATPGAGPVVSGPGAGPMGR